MVSELDRREAVAAILADRGDALVVCGLGSPCWDVAAAGDRAENFYLWGAMGGAVPMGLGLALAQPGRRVLVITGDGELLMGMGSLATVAVQRVTNLAIVCLDNERYGETGMQDSHTRFGVDLAGVARATGIAQSVVATTPDELASVTAKLYSDAGPVLAVVKVASGSAPTSLPARDGAYLKSRFREALLGTP